MKKGTRNLLGALPLMFAVPLFFWFGSVFGPLSIYYLVLIPIGYGIAGAFLLTGFVLEKILILIVTLVSATALCSLVLSALNEFAAAIISEGVPAIVAYTVVVAVIASFTVLLVDWIRSKLDPENESVEMS